MNQEWLLGVRGPLPVTKTPSKAVTRPSQADPGAFKATLEQQLDLQLKRQDVILSNHARQRLEKREIRLTDADLGRIGEAINRVAEKGGRESLIMYRGTAFVVNVQNRTIITAVDQQSMKDNVFTNIDSAMII